jgi:hypothetical protein
MAEGLDNFLKEGSMEKLADAGGPSEGWAAEAGDRQQHNGAWGDQ